MSRTTERSTQTHGALIRALATEYEQQGYYVKADHIGHRNGRPPEVGGHIPDMAAYRNGSLRIIAEAETCDTISDSDTSRQWEAFSESPYQFDAIVPKRCLAEAQRQASMWGIAVNKWWWLEA